MMFQIFRYYHEHKVTEDEPVAKSSLTRADSVDDMIAQVMTMILTNYEKVQKILFCFR